MLETIKYLIGCVGPSGYGSKSTAEQVTVRYHAEYSSTAIITGNKSHFIFIYAFSCTDAHSHL